MNRNNRAAFVAGIQGILDEIAGPVGPQCAQGMLQRRLDGLLDGLLLESQPIQETRATIVLADIRGFTALAEALPAKTLSGLLNRYFAAMVQTVERNGGFVDKFMGDSVMALFGAPKRRPDDLLRALACAVEMQHAMAEVNRESESRGEPRIYAGIAVNTGSVMAGSFGSSLYSEYTVIGDPVNLVARMEPFSLRGQILLSESSHAEARDHIEVRGVNNVRVKGKSDPLALYELHSINHPRRLVVPKIEVRKSPRVRVDFPLRLHPLAGKRVLPETLEGRALDLGYNGLLTELPAHLERGTELVTNLTPDLGSQAIGDLYARVVRVKPRMEGFETSLQFSVVDTPAHRQVKMYVDGLLWGR